MFFWNSLAFSMIKWILAIQSLVSLPFLNPAWTSGSSKFMYFWRLENFKHYFASMWNECNCAVVWTFFGIAFFGGGLEWKLTFSSVMATAEFSKFAGILLLLLLSHFSCIRTVRPHRRQPTRLHCPWDSPGKNTGVGCHFLLQCMKVKSEREVAQSCPTLSDPMDCSLPDSSIHGIFQARVLEC